MNGAVAALGALLLVGGCLRAAADHERLGDEAYREGQFATALGEYHTAQRSGARSRVWAKAAAAAIRAGDYLAAADAYVELAREDPTRTLEATIGLERVALAAERQGSAGVQAVTKAVLAIRALSPGRPLGRLARATLAGEPEPSEALGLLPGALATSGSARAVDSLLLRYGDAQRRTVACDGAVAAYQALLRRTRDPRLRTAGRDGLADCALLLGGDAVAARDGAEAERWFEIVLEIENDGDRAGTARIGLGDARVLQGDGLGAAVAYQAVLSAGTVSDSLRGVAAAKLNGLGAASSEPPADGEE